jgi:hypothetical protein
MSTDNTQSPYEPKRENRYVVSFSEPFKISEYVTHTTKRPSFTKTKNNTIVWDDMVFSMHDPIYPSTSDAIMHGMIELRKRDSYQMSIEITGLDPVGNPIEKWKVTGEIARVDFGILDWKSDEPLVIKMYFDVQSVQLLF